MNDIVDRTLKAWRQSVFQYGATDCLLSIGDYVFERCPNGPDVSAIYRGRYCDAAGAMAFVEAGGGPHGLLGQFGLEPVDLDAGEAPSRGDICVIDTGQGPDGLVGALCTGSGVAARLERGVIEVNIRFVALTHAWKVP